MSGRSKSILMTVVGMLVLSLALSAQADPRTIKKSATMKEQKDAEDYWTRERITNAPAMALQIDWGPGGIDADALSFLDEAGPVGRGESSPPGMADPYADQTAQFVYKQDWDGLYGQQANQQALEQTLETHLPAEEPAGTKATGYPYFYTYFDVNANTAFWKIYPHKWVGKLTFKTAAGTASCSATAISNNHIVTAAHCVYDTTNNRWYNSWVFTPAFRNGNAPYGTFAGTSARVLAAWMNLSGSFSINTWTRYDVALITVGKNSAGQTLNTAVGWAGRLMNAPYTQLNFNSGYPAQNYALYTLSYPAQYLRACVNESFTQSTETLGGGCYYGPGISGGSWLVGYKPFIVSGSVNSVNSGHYVGQQNMYGARFNSSNIGTLCTADGC